MINIILFLSCNLFIQNLKFEQKSIPFNSNSYVYDSKINIRLLSLKHSIERMADGDANLAINAARKAANLGLNIKDTGNYYIDNNGQVNWIYWSFNNDLPGLTNFLIEQFKESAIKGDVLILFTIGHGSKSGYLDNLGQRKDVMISIAKAAEETNQRTIWWQLSCYASAGLPKLQDMNEKQQKLLSIAATSSPYEVSYAGVEGKIMEGLFISLAELNDKIDPDKNQKITSKELKDYFIKAGRPERSSLFYSRKDSDVIFGTLRSVANEIPINNRIFPEDYIPEPSSNNLIKQ